MSINMKNRYSQGFLLVEFMIALAVTMILIGTIGRMMSLIEKTYSMSLKRLKLLSCAHGRQGLNRKELQKIPVDAQLLCSGVKKKSSVTSAVPLLLLRYDDGMLGLLREGEP